MEKRRKRLAFVNRQPTLWRHSIPAVEIVPIEDDKDETISLSPLFIAPLNADFDGDTLAIYQLHDELSLKEVDEKAFVGSYVHYDQDGSFLSTIRHESLYACYVLTEDKDYNKNNIIKIKTLQELPETQELYNNLKTGIYIEDCNKTFPYGICLFNKWCGFNKIKMTETISKNQSNKISELIYEEQKDPIPFYDKLTELNRKLLFFISSTDHSPTININEMMGIVDEDTSKLFKKLPDNNVNVGFLVNEGLIVRCLENCDHNSQLYKLFKSGTRFSRTQLARSCISIGFTADDKNYIVPNPIKGNLMEGITEEDFFLGSPGTRKSLADKSDSTPDSGSKAHFKLL
jgi:DNA-directed RNA polymerase beta' subunit